MIIGTQLLTRFARHIPQQNLVVYGLGGMGIAVLITAAFGAMGSTAAGMLDAATGADGRHRDFPVRTPDQELRSAVARCEPGSKGARCERPPNTWQSRWRLEEGRTRTKRSDDFIGPQAGKCCNFGVADLIG